ncbi:MAG: SGNH/GDSL hydrolase family protein [Clostridia bacterium]|nr:SGNH/GDSL hydrolase family protein [Clostridia bacterium]
MKKKVVLLGDSIRILGYGPKLPEMLGEDYEVWQPEENCRFVKHTLRMLFDFKDQIKDADIIHWNNGLWDVCDLFEDGILFSTDEEYVENMLRVAKLLQKITPNLIFATTTPVKEDYPYNANLDIARRNEMLVPILKDMGFKINDLYSIAIQDLDKYICEDKLHPSEAGAEAYAEKVYEMIKSFS